MSHVGFKKWSCPVTNEKTLLLASVGILRLYILYLQRNALCGQSTEVCKITLNVDLALTHYHYYQ